jgi:hypothetical protein
MPYLVNGQLVSEERVRAEEVRLQHDPQLGAIGDPAERARRLSSAAEFAAIDVMLVEQIAASDPRPIDPVALQRELRGQKAMGNCRTAESEIELCKWIDWQFRLQW